jgi:hypothetical protein
MPLTFAAFIFLLLPFEMIEPWWLFPSTGGRLCRVSSSAFFSLLLCDVNNVFISCVAIPVGIWGGLPYTENTASWSSVTGDLYAGLAATPLFRRPRPPPRAPPARACCRRPMRPPRGWHHRRPRTCCCLRCTGERLTCRSRRKRRTRFLFPLSKRRVANRGTRCGPPLIMLAANRRTRSQRRTDDQQYSER